MKKLVLGLLLIASPAYAHIRVENMTSRDGDAQKDAPCGAPGSQWGASGVTTLQPGATLTIEINEYVRHPGYFRIAFGEDANFKDPVSIQPIDPNRRTVSERDQDKASDFCSNPTVLMDNLDAHMSGGGKRSYEVKLPSIECVRCTIQIVQVMEDVIHGPYNLEVSSTSFDLPDLYHQCIDVTLAGT
ncbi:MAG TPA: SCE4755 family polysaccharide monooxygenase-like protein, partial [Polyangiales bacterium]|nr:SCE4755 family polysaccharide monooxygenase-like protein [Polyangiales bacterium]